MARTYVLDVSTRNLRAIRSAFPGAIYAPSFAAGEIASAWLQFLRAGRGGDHERISWQACDEAMTRFRTDVAAGLVQLFTSEELVEPALRLLEENVRRHIDDATCPC